jgi:polysaccharide export outer membrane protein
MTNKLLYYLFISLILSACAPTRNLTYFNDITVAGNYSEEIKNSIEPTIQPDDMLSISVSSLSPESNLLFNSGVLPSTGNVSGAANRSNEGYIVDKKGIVNFPVLGSIKLAGLTKEQARDKITDAIKNYVKNPIVNIRFLNFRITVVGEVSRPATFTIPTERVNIIEALGLAGDLTPYGKRENVLIIREKSGFRTATHVNLGSTNLFGSPYFYLQQNDIVYVAPAKAKSLQSSTSTFYLPIVTAVISILSVVLITLK